MAVDNPALLHYFLQDDLYLLPGDKDLYNGQPAPVTNLVEASVEQEPIAVQTTEQPAATIPTIPQVVETPKPAFNYLGNNKKSFLILVHYTADEHMAEAHLKALESTLGRKELALDDVAILNIAKHEGNGFDDLINHFSPERVLILGSAAKPETLTSANLNIIERLENRLHLFTYSFDEMLTDREKVKAFWGQMKNL